MLSNRLRWWEQDRYFPHLIVVFVLVLVNGLASTPRGIMLDDDGYFVLEAYYNGVAHPPGYPLYTALAHLATLVPVGSVAYRVHALSVLFAAGASAVLWALARRLLRSASLAYIPALTFAWSDVFWSQSIVAEVYSLNALLFFSLLLMCVHYARNAPSSGRGRLPLWTAFLYGLSLSNHWPLIILSTPALVLVLWPRRQEFLKRWPLLLGAVALGLTPYLWMVVRSRVSHISFYGPISNWHDFWFYVSREGYRTVDQDLSAGWRDKLQFGGYVLRQTLAQFGPLGWAPMLLGLVWQWRRWRPWESWGLVLGYLGSTFILIGLLGFNYDLLHRNVFRVYPVLSYGICALWLGLGAQVTIGWLDVKFEGRARSGYLRWGTVLVLAGTTWLANAGDNYRGRDQWAENYARTVLDTLPRDVIFFASGDYVVGPVGYLHRIEHVRPDVTLYDVRGQLFKNRLYPAYELSKATVRTAVDKFLSHSKSPVYYAMELPHSGGNAFYGLYWRVYQDQPAGHEAAILTPRIHAFFDDILGRGPPRDLSELIHYRQLADMYCQLLSTLKIHAASAVEKQQLSRELALRCSDYHGMLERVVAMLNAPHPDAAAALNLLKRARRQAGQAVTVDDRARLELETGRAELALHHRRSAHRYFRRSVAIWKSHDNPAYRLLRKTAPAKSGG